MEIDRERLIQKIQQSHGWGMSELTEGLPNYLEVAINERIWEGWPSRSGEPFESFYAFAVADIPEGLALGGQGRDKFTYDDAVRFCEVRRVDVARMVRAEIPAANRHGGKRAKSQGDVIPLAKQRGTSASHLTARLKRDHPDIAADLAAGKYRSVRAAAIAAGIVKVPSGLDRMRREWAKATPEERATFAAEIAAARAIR